MNGGSPAPDATPPPQPTPSVGRDEFVLYCDGASRGNPGAAAIGYALFAADGTEILGRVRMDSELEVRQIQGVYRVKHPGLQPLFAAVGLARAGFEAFRIEHVPRAQNARADALANAALDALKSPEK
jgi:ribonuclease HI